MNTKVKFSILIASIALLATSCKDNVIQKPMGFKPITQMSTAVVSATGQKIILKLDDFGTDATFNNAGPVLDWLITQNIKASIGVIASKIETASMYTPYKNAKYKALNLFEIWNHGFLHKRFSTSSGMFEFYGTSLSEQRASFTDADNTVFAKLGVHMHSFGAPYNKSDANTNTVLTENPAYKVFMFASVTPPSSILDLDSRVDMEKDSAGNVNLAHFISQYNAKKDTYPYSMVLQGHPGKWDSARLNEFKGIISFLQDQGCSFVLPYEYYFISKGIKATVYQNCSYGGWGIALGIGSYDQARLASLGVTNDDISSIKVPAGLKVTLFQNDNFSGTSSTLTADITCFGGLNNQVSSLVVGPAY